MLPSRRWCLYIFRSALTHATNAQGTSVWHRLGHFLSHAGQKSLLIICSTVSTLTSLGISSIISLRLEKRLLNSRLHSPDNNRFDAQPYDLCFEDVPSRTFMTFFRPGFIPRLLSALLSLAKRIRAFELRALKDQMQS